MKKMTKLMSLMLLALTSVDAAAAVYVEKNVATNATASATNTGQYWKVANLNDGNTTTMWCNWYSSAGCRESETLTIAWTDAQDLCSTKLVFSGDATPVGTGSTYPASYKVQYLSGEEWLDVTLKEGSSYDVTAESAVSFETVSTTSLRVVLTANTYNGAYCSMNVNEIEAYALQEFDPSSVITNPEFDNGTNGWTKTNGTFVTKTSNKGMFQNDGTRGQIWGASSGKVYQTLPVLPAGTYRLKAACNITGTSATLYAGEAESPMVSDEYTAVAFTSDGVNAIEIGISFVASTIDFDHFSLETADPVEIALPTCASKWATFIAPFACTLPDGVTAYTVGTDAMSGSYVTLTENGNAVAANTPVILYSDATINETVTGIAINTKEAYTKGLLTGTLSAQTIKAGERNYILQNQDGEIGFYRIDEDRESAANRCYLTVPETQNVKCFTFGAGQETAISALQALTSGQAVIYDLNGRRLSCLQKGINIVNGKKVMVK